MIPPPKILIVDDEPRNLDALEAMLDNSGCTLIRAQSADDALLALLDHEFAAMILDIRMPGMSGIELADLIKQRRRTQHVPILFLTAHMVDDSDVLRGYSVGAVDYLSKPVNSNILRSKVAVFVELHRKTQALADVNAALERINQELELRVSERTAALTVAHAGVKANEERLRMAMEVAEIAAWEWDMKSGLVTWSTDPETLFGFPRGSFGAEMRITRTVHPDDLHRVNQAIQHAIATRGTYESEYRAVRPDGGIVWITESGRAILGDDGAVTKMVGVSRDVSAQRRAEHERERLLVSERMARDEAERQSRLKDEFLATLSHELRTPMNAILGWLSMLAEEEAVRDPVQAIAIIRRNAELQAKLIEDLLQMNQLTSGTLNLELGAVDPSAALDTAIQSVRPAASGKSIELVVHVAPKTPQVAADGARLQQILWNLLHNAVKFTPPGGRVAVSAAPSGRHVRISVSDNGEGIEPEFLPHVFDRFRQADSSTTRHAWGLGIGLSIVKHLVELHGGTIHAASPGRNLGATFSFELPVAKATARIARQAEDAGLGRTL